MIIRNTAGEIGPGIDTKGASGYVIAAGVHQSGATYCSEGQPIAIAPNWLLDLVKERPAPKKSPAPIVPRASETTSRYGRAVLEAEARAVALAPIGEGNLTLYAAALKLGSLEAGGELAHGDAQRALEDAAESWEIPDHCSAKTILSGLENGRKNPRRAPERATRSRA